MSLAEKLQLDFREIQLDFRAISDFRKEKGKSDFRGWFTGTSF
jgi:hypothetical protein